MAVFTGGAVVDLGMDQFACGSAQRADIELQEGGNDDVTDNIYKLQHPKMEPDTEEQIVIGFKERNVKKLRDLLLSTSMNNCRNCNCQSRQSVDWKKVMNELRRTRGCDRVNILSTFKILVRDLPEVANKVLNGCVTCKEVDSGQFKMVYEVDYLFLEEYSGQRQENDDDVDDAVLKKTDVEAPPQEQCYNDSFVVQYKVKRTKLSHNLSSLELISKNDRLLIHPVVMSYLRGKWKKYLAVCYFLNLGLYLFFLGCLTTFALTIHTPLDPICNGTIINETTNDAEKCDFPPGKREIVTIVGLCTIGFSSIRLLMEICELINFDMMVFSCSKGTRKGRRLSVWRFLRKCIHWKYLAKPENYLEIPLYTLAIYFSFSFYAECLCPTHGAWQVGIIAILFAWINLLLFFNKWPLLGKYIAMFQAILVRFMKVLIIAVVLLVAFSLAFYMALHEPELPDTPFESPQITMAETISQVIGSPDFSIFRLVNDDTMRRQVPFKTLSVILWIVFGTCISVLFITFLTALAVHDVSELKIYGKRKRTELMITLFVEIENLKRAFQLICCCNRHNSLNEDQEEKTEVDAPVPSKASVTKSVALSSVSVTPHSRVKALSFVVGVDSIDTLVSDLDHSIRCQESVL